MLLVSRLSGLLMMTSYDPLLSAPSPLRCSPRVHIPRFQIFLNTACPCFWLSTAIPFAFDVANIKLRNGKASHNNLVTVHNN